MTGRDDFLSKSHLLNPKMFDQELRESLREKMIETTYLRLKDRFKGLLNPKIKDSMTNVLDKVIEDISS